MSAEPLWCWKCGAYDNDCDCGWPDEETPPEDYKFCEVCGADSHDGECDE
jgi:hypothetical protein